MICPKCGHETSGNFCNNCGALLRRSTPPAAGGNQDIADAQRRYTGGQSAERKDISGQGAEQQDISQQGAGQQDISWQGTGQQDTGSQAARGRRMRAWAPDGEQGESGAAVSGGADQRGSGFAQEAACRQTKNKIESREERRENVRKREKSGNNSGKASGRRSAPKDSGSSGPGKKELRFQQKDKKLRDNRMRDLESEVERLTERERLLASRRAEDGEYDEPDSGPGLGELAAKGAAGVVILLSRVMQLLSFILMGCMVLIMLRSYLVHGASLGNIRYIAAERNYGLALYAGAAAASLFMGIIWCLWILSRKGAGGGFRLKKYDTGRGLIPFLLCAAVVYAAGPALTWIPPSAGIAEEWRGIVTGAAALLTAVNVHRSTLLFCSGAGTVLSLVRRVLLV